MSAKNILGLFEGIGIEIEYMIVRQDSLDILPMADELIKSVVGSYSNDYEKEDICWSNELALHVLELKTCGPVGELDSVMDPLQTDIRRINDILANLNGMLMPSGAHPWMDPARDARLWPHGQRRIYETYHRIFNCSGHGWTNLQSCHINLPFKDSAEFGRLHAAVRLLLPIIPALTASTPILDGCRQPYLDTRMEYYRTNSVRIPSITGDIIPEPVFSRKAYESEIFQRMYRDIAPLDGEGILRDEWLNARGAIARFDRNTIEIRIIDTQECVTADLAVAALIESVLQAMVEQRWCDYASQKAWPTMALKKILLDAVRAGEGALISDQAFLASFGIKEKHSVSAAELWSYLTEQVAVADNFTDTLQHMICHGTLASRILKALAGNFTRQSLATVYRELATCLSENRLFLP